jgi:hypothetical protein
VTTLRTAPIDLNGHTVDTRLVALPRPGCRHHRPHHEPARGGRSSPGVASSLEDGDPSGARDDRRGSMSGQNRYGCCGPVLDRPEWLAKEVAGHRDHSLKPPPLAATTSLGVIIWCSVNRRAVNAWHPE